MDRVILADGLINIRCGRWQDVLADVEQCDAVICDPPYSPRQSDGFRSHRDLTRKAGNRPVQSVHSGTICAFQGMPYAPFDAEQATDLHRRFVSAPWIVAFGDHVSFAWNESAANNAGRYCFAPVIWIRGNGPRFQGDGPCCAAEYICVSRPRGNCKIGSLPGFYDINNLRGGQGQIVTGQKPLGLMRAIVRDYTKPGDLVVDPFCGGGTTALACAYESRRCITSEMDPDTYALAVKRLERDLKGLDVAARQLRCFADNEVKQAGKRLRRAKQGMLV